MNHKDTKDTKVGVGRESLPNLMGLLQRRHINEGANYAYKNNQEETLTST